MIKSPALIATVRTYGKLVYKIGVSLWDQWFPPNLETEFVLLILVGEGTIVEGFTTQSNFYFKLLHWNIIYVFNLIPFLYRVFQYFPCHGELFIHMRCFICCCMMRIYRRLFRICILVILFGVDSFGGIKVTIGVRLYYLVAFISASMLWRCAFLALIKRQKCFNRDKSIWPMPLIFKSLCQSIYGLQYCWWFRSYVGLEDFTHKNWKFTL